MGIEVENIDPTTLDEQPFGILRLDQAGNILSYNLYEERLAGCQREDMIGKNFFREVAPCTRVKRFYGRFLDGVRRRSLNVTFGFVFLFPSGKRTVELTLYYREDDDSVWMLVRG